MAKILLSLVDAETLVVVSSDFTHDKSHWPFAALSRASLMSEYAKFGAQL